MASHWKSTPSYWCKFCSTYVRDTSLERKNHEASAKHQNAIQRNLRDLQRGKLQEDREKQRAKDEVARLNGLVSGRPAQAGGGASVVGISGLKDMGRSSAVAPAANGLSAAAQRKKHAEELLAMGVELPEELKKEVTGLGSWHTVAERVVEEEPPRSLSDILKKEEGEEEEEGKDDVGVSLGRGVRKRKVDEEVEDARDEEAAPRRQEAWGSRMRKYPGGKVEEGEGEDLEALLSGVGRKDKESIKEEGGAAGVVQDGGGVAVKAEDVEGSGEVVPAVVFKKRKVKR